MTGLLNRLYPTLTTTIPRIFDSRMENVTWGVIDLAPEPAVVYVIGQTKSGKALAVHEFGTGATMYERGFEGACNYDTFPQAIEEAQKAFDARIRDMIGPTGILASVRRDAAKQDIKLPADMYEMMSSF